MRKSRYDTTGLYILGTINLTETEHHPIRRRWQRKEHCRQREAGARPAEPLGRDQRRGREPLRVCVSAKLLDTDAPAGSDRNDEPDPLRDIPGEAAAGAEGEQRAGSWQRRCRRRGCQSTDQPVCGSGAEPQLTARRDEWILNGGRNRKSCLPSRSTFALLCPFLIDIPIFFFYQMFPGMPARHVLSCFPFPYS